MFIDFNWYPQLSYLSFYAETTEGLVQLRQTTYTINK